MVEMVEYCLNCHSLFPSLPPHIYPLPSYAVRHQNSSRLVGKLLYLFIYSCNIFFGMSFHAALLEKSSVHA